MIDQMFSEVFTRYQEGESIPSILASIKESADQWQSIKTEENAENVETTLHAMRVCYNRFLQIQKREQERESSPILPDHTTPNGIYTVVMQGYRYTIKLADDWREDSSKDSQCAYFLNGPDNERNYKGFAFVKGNQYHVWSKHKSNIQLTTALAFLLQSDFMVHGLEYAVSSGNCWRCGRTLTVPASIHRGLGPICAEHLGVA